MIPAGPNSFYAYPQVIIRGLKGMRIEERAGQILDYLSRLQGDEEQFRSDSYTLSRHTEHARKKYKEAERRLNQFEDKLLAPGESVELEGLPPPGHDTDPAASSYTVPGCGTSDRLLAGPSSSLVLARRTAAWPFDPSAGQARSGQASQRCRGGHATPRQEMIPAHPTAAAVCSDPAGTRPSPVPTAAAQAAPSSLRRDKKCWP